MTIEIPQYSLGEEIANSITHGIGFLLSLGILGVLCAFASLYGNVWHIVGTAIFAISAIFLYLASTIYHSISHYKTKIVLRIIDHSAIFLLIAGTYTPFALVNLRGAWGWSILVAIWTIAIFGIVFQFFMIKKKKIYSVILYLLMGWIIIIAIKPFLKTVETGGLILLLVGGLFYSFGTIFYMLKKLPFNHAIWHCFVLFGTLSHFFAILFYVIPIA